MAFALPALVETHAVKAKATIPSIGGTTYRGTLSAQGHTFSITVAFGAESAKGVLTSTIVSSDVSAGLSFACKGTVKSTRAVALAGRFGKLTLAVRAKLSATLGTLAGKAVVHGKQSVGGFVQRERRHDPEFQTG